MVAQDEDNTAAGKKAKRGRGCNESFRAAVDRSYEQAGEAMETGNHGYTDFGWQGKLCVLTLNMFSLSLTEWRMSESVHESL